MRFRRKQATLNLDHQRQMLVELATSDFLTVRERVIDAIEALRRIETGDYGLCALCDHDIEVQRLEVRPEAPLCAKCQSRQDEYLAA
ncbi:MAG: TraR/DksA C4-type zinc finger protein [Phycisphaerales bacterium]|nr:TraR/DksA C4-type zinc finger protein [Phycisphaerales bacterium]